MCPHAQKELGILMHGCLHALIHNMYNYMYEPTYLHTYTPTHTHPHVNLSLITFILTSSCTGRQSLRSASRGDFVVPHARTAIKQHRAFSIVGPSL